ncbi:MAG: hypothetical protein AAGC88_14145, partial [Bacteroidota bacterium]
PLPMTLSRKNQPIDAEGLWLLMANSGKRISLSCVRSSLNWLVSNRIASKGTSTTGQQPFSL